MLETQWTQKLAEFIVDAKLADMSNDVRSQAVAPVIDSVAVMLAGRGSDAGRGVIQYSREVSLAGSIGGPCWAVGLADGAPADVAALINSTCAHALDYDDALPGAGHPSALVLAAILATAQAAGVALDGDKLTEAFVLGFEVTAKVAKAIGVAHYFKGWHTTCTAGSFGAAAAAAKILGLDVRQASVALGIAASLVSGLQRNFGTMTKPLHSGLAARNGVTAVFLARGGFSASANILDGPRGFLDVYGVSAEHPENLDNLGSPWSLNEPGTALKMYPCCYAIARSAYAALQLADEYNYAPDDIDAIISKTPKGGLQTLIYDRPDTGLHGKFSMQYVLSAALIDHKLALESFTDEAVRRPDVRALMTKVSSTEVRSLHPEDPEALVSSPTAGGHVELTVKTRSGRSDTITVSDPPGSPQNPMSRSDLKSKFMNCARWGGFNIDQVALLLPRLIDWPATIDFASLIGDLAAEELTVA